ncbi:MAG TPA: type III pantothenate kinase [Verrucomicrobiae bacterium]|nr:type III pantothenate kinase [Verrucomicrobiae bacterium]
MKERPFLLININNTNTSFALATPQRIVRVVKVRTTALRKMPFAVSRVSGIVLASVVPDATKRVLRLLGQAARSKVLRVSAGIDLGIGVRYPRKKQIGADRLANAVGVAKGYGAPAIVVDFGTAVTFDIINARREYVGGIIAPGLASVTDYLYQRTALLPHITLVEPHSVIGKSTIEAMRIGAVVGYRGLVREILGALKHEPGMKKAIVVATGGYGELIARKVPGIKHVNPLLTLEGLRLIAVRNFT